MIYTRQRLEEREAQTLAPYGLKSRDSRGRAYQPDPEPEDRTAFQRDRDRILHTTAFRRLEYKTQVFINHEGDYYRTRLTHTLEVAQIGRTLARALGGNEDLVEAIALSHDVGHPPFGHSGEVALNRLMREHGGFDHNKQSLRIVTKLEHRYANWPGLNLTWEVREGIVKHETAYDVADASEYDADKRGHLEAQICNVADELAYTAHDLDDGLRARLIEPPELAGLALWEMARDSIGWKTEAFEELTRHRLIRRLIGLEVDDLVHAASQRLDQAHVASVDALQRLTYNVVNWSAAMAEHNQALKNFLYQNLYRHYRVMRMQVKAENIVSDLFQAYLRVPAQLPNRVQQRLKDTGHLERVICDYIAGMTDRFALDEHDKLFDPHALP
jgi:dGTPase